MTMMTHLQQATGLLSALDAARNIRAAALMLSGFALAALLVGLAGVLGANGSWLLGGLFSIVAIVSAFYAAHAVGIMMADEARGRLSRPILDAIVQSLSTGHRLLGVFLVVSVIYILGLLFILLLMFLCKVPVLGPFLYTAVFPLSVLLCGIGLFALFSIVIPLAAPAIWNDATVMQTVSALIAIVRGRALEVVMSMVVLLFVVGLIGSVIGSTMFIGTLLASGLSATVLADSMVIDIGGLVGGMMGGKASRGMGGLGYAVAAGIGGSIVWAVAATLPSLVYLRGCNLVYLQHADQVDSAAAEGELRTAIDSAKRKMTTPEATSASGSNPSNSSTTSTTPTTPASAESVCPACHSPVTAQDVFCGSCGHRVG